MENDCNKQVDDAVEYVSQTAAIVNSAVLRMDAAILRMDRRVDQAEVNLREAKSSVNSASLLIGQATLKFNSEVDSIASLARRVDAIVSQLDSVNAPRDAQLDSFRVALDEARHERFQQVIRGDFQELFNLIKQMEVKAEAERHEMKNNQLTILSRIESLEKQQAMKQ